MTNLIALHGYIGSGKTTLAKELVKNGYLQINFTDLLKSYVVSALRPHNPLVTVDYINANKEFYRPLINAFGDAIDFSNDPAHVFEALREWSHSGQPCAVFDCVRSINQAIVVRALGFKVVRLEADYETLNQRRPATEEMRNHPIERPLPSEYIDYCIDCTQSIEEVTRQVLGL